ncbi:MAG: hypothetical protein RL026_2191 [Pseudomonadota bacterium]|jgi:short subunit dehydrogenase-like uncharacterized protein
MDSRWLLYGANGYTGALIAREALQRGLRPVLAGRSEASLRPLADDLGLEVRVFTLDDGEHIAQQLQGFTLVLNCAGPFSATAGPMMEACLRAGVHYLDITGEIAVFELAQSLSARAKAAGVVLCPGVGFDVIPTDCLAALLKAALPDATVLALGFDTRSGLSAGTAKTSLQGLGQGGKARRGGKIISVPFAHRLRRIDFGDGEKLAMTIPWGDVSTAFHTTGIPDIEVYVPTTRGRVALLRVLYRLRRGLSAGWLQRWLADRIGRSVRGPDAAQREASPSFVWGEARNARGEVVTARLRTANGYSLTVSGALAVVAQVLEPAAPLDAGACTPSQLAGADLVTRLPGSGTVTLTRR